MVVKQVNINDKPHPVYFGFNALRIYCETANKTLKELDSIGQNMDLNDAVCLIWAGLKDGARKQKTEFTLTVDDLADEFDTDMDAVTRCLNVFAEFQSVQAGGNVKGRGKK